MPRSLWTGALALICPTLTLAAPGDLQLISARNPAITAPSSPNGGSIMPAVSGDGRFVAYVSDATDIVPGDTNERYDIFVHDRTTGATERVSVNSSGGQADTDSFDATITSDGTLVTFASRATNLVSVDTNPGSDVFVRNRLTGVTRLISINNNGEPGSADSFSPVMSSDGRYVAFISGASNLVPGDDNFTADVFVFDLRTNTVSRLNIDPAGFPEHNAQPEAVAISADGNRIAVTRVDVSFSPSGQPVFSRAIVVTDASGTAPTVASADSQYPALSGNGRYLSFTSGVDGQLFVHDLQTGSRLQTLPGTFEPASLSYDGRLIVLSSTSPDIVPDDTNGVSDVFYYTLPTGNFSRVSVGTSSGEGSGASERPALSADGRFVAFGSDSALGTVDGNGTLDIFVRDLQFPSTALVSVAHVKYTTAPGWSGTGAPPSVSSGARYVAFGSVGSLFVANDTNGVGDVFVRDRSTNTMSRISVASDGTQANGESDAPSINGAGRFVAFESLATNLVSGDTNGIRDIFVKDRQTGSTTRVSVGAGGAQSNGDSSQPFISSNGRFVAFVSSASNLVVGDTNALPDIFVHDRQTGATARVSVGPGGIQASSFSNGPSLSFDGRLVAFSSRASNLVAGDTNNASDVFVHDRQTGATTRISVNSDGEQGNEDSSSASMSAYGRYVAFTSTATNLTPVSGGRPTIFGVYVRDLNLGKTARASVATGVGDLDGIIRSRAAVSGDGRYVVFHADDSSWVGGDNNGQLDVFIRDMRLGLTRVASARPEGSAFRLGNAESWYSSISENGRFVAFSSGSTNFVADDLNRADDIFLHETQTGTAIRVNAGGAGYTDTRGLFWEADRGYNTGTAATYTAPIAGTDDDVLFQTERWDPVGAPDMQYSFTVPNGKYSVLLYLAENYAPNFAPGKRQWGWMLEGHAGTLVDIFAAVGAQTALVFRNQTDVNDGRLDIGFVRGIENPNVNAIEIVEEQRLLAP